MNRTHYIAAFATLVALMISGAEPRNAEAQQSGGQTVLQGISALVNDEIISTLDLRERLGLVLAATGGVNSEEELRQLQEQVLRNMVDERLQLQEAAEWQVAIDERELEDAFLRIAQSFGQSPEQLSAYLEQYGSTKRSLLTQLRAEFAWQQLVNGRLGRNVIISEEEVQTTLQRLLDSAGNYEFRVGEIYLIVDQPSRDASVRGTAERIISQIRDDGAPFSAVARQFSEASSAATGGDLGWVAEGQLSDELNTALMNLEVGEISNPIRTPGGYYILTVADRRRILSADPLDAQLNLWQIYFQFDETTTQESAEEWAARAELYGPTLSSCNDIPSLTSQLAPATSGDIGNLSIRDLGPELRTIVQNVPVGGATPPIASPDGIRLLVVCGKQMPEIQMPTEDDIYAQLEQQKLALMARRYLRDLRRDAIIDYR